MEPEATAELVEEIRREALTELDSLITSEALEGWRVAYLGRRGRLTTILRSVGALPPEVRQKVGSLGNQSKTLLEERLAQRSQALKEAEFSNERLASEERIDITLPGRPVNTGRLHPTTQVVREICDAFVAMGFQVVEGPEVEWDKYNFEMLNIPRDHPARDMWNSLWIDYLNEQGDRSMLLRTHTSPIAGQGDGRYATSCARDSTR